MNIRSNLPALCRAIAASIGVQIAVLPAIAFAVFTLCMIRASRRPPRNAALFGFSPC